MRQLRLSLVGLSENAVKLGLCNGCSQKKLEKGEQKFIVSGGVESNDGPRYSTEEPIS